MKKFSPMLAEGLPVIDDPGCFERLRWPKYGSPKLDGLRALIVDGKLVSRNLKPFRNAYTTALFRGLPAFDGEVIVGSPNEGLVLNRTNSGVTSASGAPDVWLYVFDVHNIPDPFVERLAVVERRVRWAGHPRLKLLPQVLLLSPEAALTYEQARLAEGYEGIMLRDPDGLYKSGRATLKQEWLLKVKRFRDGEAIIFAYEEAQENANEAKKNALGLTERSTHKVNMRPKGMVGTILATDVKTGAALRCGPGRLTHAERISLWTEVQRGTGMSGIGRRFTYRVFDYGAKDTPRFPLFHSWREKGL